MTVPPSMSSFTAADPTGYSPAPAALTKSFEQMRLVPCGDGLRAAWGAGSQCQLK
jgi:hypothetical protein